MKMNFISYIIMTILLTPSRLISGESQEKWKQPKECINHVIPNFRVEGEKISLKTPHKGVRFAYKKGDNEIQIANYNQEIFLDNKTPLKLYEKHKSLEIIPFEQDGKIRFIVIATSDFRSFGGKLETFFSAFEIKNGSLIVIKETEGRKAFEAMRTSEKSNQERISK